MKCVKPVAVAGLFVGCGQCMPCRFNRRRVWSHRIMLEAGEHEHSCFLTLTYDDASLPESGNLDPAHLRDFLKRLRAKVSPTRVRFFGVGEYGDESLRPHYHVAIFGYPGCERGRTPGHLAGKDKVCCEACGVYKSAWGHGGVLVGTLTADSAQYVCGYVTKKMTDASDPRLKGRVPEFARMSLKPGIGYMAMHDVADAFLSFDLEGSQGDVPSALRHGTRLLPLGRYLKGKLREMTGMEDGSQFSIEEARQEVREVRADQKVGEKVWDAYDRRYAQTTKNKLARLAIFKQRKSL